MEIKQEIEGFLINKKCDKCNKGTMRKVSVDKKEDDRGYIHICDKCSHEEKGLDEYPKIEWDFKMKFTTLDDIKKVIFKSGLTQCEDTNCDRCPFNKHSPESKEFGIENPNICIMLNEVYRTK